MWFVACRELILNKELYVVDVVSCYCDNVSNVVVLSLSMASCYYCCIVVKKLTKQNQWRKRERLIICPYLQPKVESKIGDVVSFSKLKQETQTTTYL